MNIFWQMVLEHLDTDIQNGLNNILLILFRMEKKSWHEEPTFQM